MKRVRNPIILAKYEDRYRAKPLEPIANEEDNDLIIKNKDGQTNTSVYEMFRQRLYVEGYISNMDQSNTIENKIFGFNIDMSESDPDASTIYIEHSGNFTPLSFNMDGSCDYGSWEPYIKSFFGIRPCILKNGNVVHYLLDTNYETVEDMVNIDIESGDNGDVFIEFKQLYYKIAIIDNNFIFRVANYKVDETYSSNAFLSENGSGDIKDHMYISAYDNTVVDGLLRSISGQNIFAIIKSLTEARDVATDNGSSYQNMSYFKYLYLLCLSWLLFKTSNINTVLNTSTRIETTGLFNQKGLFYSGPDGHKVFGIENFFSNTFLLEGIMYANNTLYYKLYGEFSSDKRKYNRVANINLLGSGYIDTLVAIEDNKILLPFTLKGSSNEYFGLYNEVNDTGDTLEFAISGNKLTIDKSVYTYPKLIYC